MPDATIVLKRGREKVVQQRHPWIFTGAIEEVRGDRTVGAVTDVLAHHGEWLARGLMHPDAGLAVRVYTWTEEEPLDAAFFRAKLDQAIQLRAILFPESGSTNAYRLVFSESDGLSGVIVDRYADLLAIRVSARVLLPHLGEIIAHLKARTGLERVYVSADQDAAQREGFDLQAVEDHTTDNSEVVEILENGLRFEVDVRHGQKTGFFLDQRFNRQRVAAYAGGRSVLSAYCYTGAFETYAAQAGAVSVLGLDSSAAALARAEHHLNLNRLEVPREYVRGDVTHTLRKFRDAGKSFGLIVVDPPRFVANRQQREKGLRAYKDVNLWALKLMEPGGVLATFSCSALVSRDDLRDTLKWAAFDAHRSLRIIESLGQPADHPVLPHVGESDYLKGFLCYIS